jgi:hypothetical protein
LSLLLFGLLLLSLVLILLCTRRVTNLRNMSDPLFTDCAAVWNTPHSKLPAHKDLCRLASRVVVWVSTATATSTTAPVAAAEVAAAAAATPLLQQLRDSAGISTTSSLDSDDEALDYEIDELVNSLPSALPDVEPHAFLHALVTTSALRTSAEHALSMNPTPTPTSTPTPTPTSTPTTGLPPSNAAITTVTTCTVPLSNATGQQPITPISHVARIVEPISRFFETPDKHTSIMAFINNALERTPKDLADFAWDLFNHVMGVDSKTATLFKAINQAMIMPATLHFRTLMANGMMLKDFQGPDGWRIIVSLSDRVVNITHLRREQSLGMSFGAAC